MRIVIVGAGHAGVQVAASLRQGGFAGSITLIGDEPGLPYQRPPLSKAFLAGEMDEAELPLRPATFYAKQDIALSTGDPARKIELATRELVLASGTRHGYDHLILATGAANRTLPGAAGIAYLRSRDEARALKTRLATVRHAVVIGAGFIGLEFAAVAAELGRMVTVIEQAARPLARGVSAEMAAHIATVHANWGTVLLTNTGVRAVTADAVEISDGRVIAADLVLAAIGVVPNTALAEAAGLPVADGIVVDAQLLTSDPAISAIGDCARFPAGTDMIRLESVQNAADQARAVADRLLGRSTAPYDRLAWFWSDQGALKLQIAGLSTGHDRIIRRNDPSGGFSLFCFTGDRLCAVESLNRPSEHMLARRLVTRATLTPEQAGDPRFDLRDAA